MEPVRQGLDHEWHRVDRLLLGVRVRAGVRVGVRVRVRVRVRVGV